MSGCARTCLLWILGWVAGACAFFFFLRRYGIVDPQIWWASGIGGFCIGTAAGFVVGAFGLAKERRSLLDAAMGVPPRDGEWVAVSGTIRSSDPLPAPISGVESAVYEYRITREDRSTSESSTLLFYEGNALTPTTIGTRFGAVRLLAVPTLDVPYAKVERARAIENAKRYVASTTFETSATPKDQRKGVTKESTDDSGVFRVDRESHGGTDEIEECDFEEKHVRQGETVCVFGLYSRQRGGIVPHRNWAKLANVTIGNGNDVAEKLRKRMWNWSIAALGLALVAIGAAALYIATAS